MSDNYCVIALDYKGYTISTWEQLPWREHREFERKITGRVSNFDSRYPAWTAKGTSTYYDKNKLTGAVTNYSSATNTYVVSSYRSYEYRYNGEYVGTNADVITGNESAIYGYVANKMTSSYPNMWIGQWSHTIEGNVSFTVADGICYRPDGTTTPPNGLPPPPARIYLGNAAPPPLPPKNMNCCSCNDIATIVENQSIQQLRAQEKLFEQLKDHVDKRALEIIIKDLEHLKALDYEEFLKAVIKRINELESNLWNGPQQ